MRTRRERCECADEAEREVIVPILRALTVDSDRVPSPGFTALAKLGAPRERIQGISLAESSLEACYDALSAIPSRSDSSDRDQQRFIYQKGVTFERKVQPKGKSPRLSFPSFRFLRHRNHFFAQEKGCQAEPFVLKRDSSASIARQNFYFSSPTWWNFGLLRSISVTVDVNK